MKVVNIVRVLVAFVGLHAVSTVSAEETAQPAAIHAQAQSPHDSLNNKDNVLAIQDDFSVYENFQYITQEKTVFVTLTPTTVYVTITKVIEPKEMELPDQVTVTEVVSSTSLPALPVSVEESTTTFLMTQSAPTPLISSVVIVATETAVKTYFTTEIFIHSEMYANVSSSVITGVSSTSSYVVPTGTDIRLFPTTGELDMVLGDRKSFMNYASTTFSSVSSKSYAAPSFEVPIAPITESVTETLVTETFDVSSVVSTITTNTPEPLTLDPFSDAFTSTTTSSVSNGGNYTVSQTVAQNMTGLEQLLENFSPYHDLPTADYELSNGGGRLRLTGTAGAVGVLAVLLAGILM